MDTKNTLIDKIEKDKRMDRLIRKTCIGSWSMLLLISIVHTLLIINQYLMALGSGIQALYVRIPRGLGSNGWIDFLTTVTIPFVGPFVIFLFVGILSSVAILVRMRTSSLRDIQLRLGTLENALLQGDRDGV